MITINWNQAIFECLLSDLKNHPTGITIADKNIWSAQAAEIGKLHAIPVDDIDKGKIISKKSEAMIHSNSILFFRKIHETRIR